MSRALTRRSALIALLLAVLAGGASLAHADPKRPIPDYDGQGNPDADGGSWVLWLPRILMSPLYLVNEFVLRRPLGAVFRVAERNHWASWLSSGSSRGALAPTALFEVGLLPSVGLEYSYGDRGPEGNLFSVLATTWGGRRLELAARDLYSFDGGAQAVLARVAFRRRQDLLFLGLGPDVTDRTRSRYGLQQIEGGLGYHRRLGGPLAVGLDSGLGHIAYIDGDCCGDPSLAAAIADGSLPAPPGYGADYTAIFARAELTLDARDLRSGAGSGLYLRLHGDASFDLGAARAWIDHGAAVGAAVDLTGHQRVLRLQLAVDFADPLRGDAIPFNEQAALGSDRMPGFITGWMVGRSTAAAQLGYSWPIWIWLHGQLVLAVGNTFGEHLDGFAARKLRLSGAVGITTSPVTEHAFEILFGLGSETFEQGAAVTSVRFAIGWRGGL